MSVVQFGGSGYSPAGSGRVSNTTPVWIIMIDRTIKLAFLSYGWSVVLVLRSTVHLLTKDWIVVHL